MGPNSVAYRRPSCGALSFAKTVYGSLGGHPRSSERRRAAGDWV